MGCLIYPPIELNIEQHLSIFYVLVQHWAQKINVILIAQKPNGKGGKAMGKLCHNVSQ